MKQSYFRLQFVSAFLGNLFEHYDLALYSLLTPFFASIFFADQDTLMALILTFGIIPLGMLARPIGAIIFGYIGDRYGRHHALFFSLLGLAIVSGLFAFAPTYKQAGIFAPFILLFGRMLQNFFGIGENLGGAIYLLENSDEKHQNFISSLYGSSTVAGYLLASAGVSYLCYYGAVEECWRYLYLIGCVTAVFGAILRRKLPNNRDFAKPASIKKFSIHKLISSFWQYRQAVLLIALVSGFSYATYSISLVFFNGFIPLISTITKESMVNLNTALLLIDFFTLPLFGLLSNHFSRQKVMMAASLCMGMVGVPLFILLEGASLSIVIIIRLLIVLLGVWFAAPFHAWAQKLVPPEHRYTIISFGYAIGSQIFGSPTASISLWFYKQTNLVWGASCYWVLLAMATSACLAWAVQQREVPVYFD